MVEINCETDFVARNEDFQQFVKDVAMHVAAMNPQFLDRDSVPTDTVTKEKEILAAQIADEGKPANIVEKMLKAESASSLLRIVSWNKCSLRTLVTRRLSKQSKLTLSLRSARKISVRRFVRFELGEGMEKRTKTSLLK